jgi:putative hydrolase of the HAD superfamily
MGRLEQMNVGAVGLDLGNTLMQYDGVPLNWQEHYAPALREVCARLGLEADGERLRAACGRLSHYNTRLYPREIEIPADTIFRDVLGCFGVASTAEVEAAVDAFFGYFRQSFRVFDDALPFLHSLQSEGIPAGILTDVPYGMPARWVEHDVSLFRPTVACVLLSTETGLRNQISQGSLPWHMRWEPNRSRWPTSVTSRRTSPEPRMPE